MNDYVINVSGLSKSFNGKPAVIDAKMQVRPGEIYGFLGPNGSGKTTTIRMLCGLLTPDAGKGHCLGFDILKQSAQIKRQVGYMTQYFSLYQDLSIKENLDFIARLYAVKNCKQAVEQSLEELGLTQRQKQLAGTLSGGWKQRLALSAALIHKPKLLLLDEPTAGVDPKARREFWDHIHHLSAKGITTLVSTHYMDEAARCTRLAYISFGSILVRGAAEEIIAHSNLITWQVTGGGDLVALSEKIRSMSGVEQVAAFGNSLHVCGKNKELLNRAIEQVKTDEFAWKQIKPDLEDIFISLVGGEK